MRRARILALAVVLLTGGAPRAGHAADEIIAASGAGDAAHPSRTSGSGMPPSQPSLVAAVLPSTRSVEVGTTATAFVTIINAGAGTALNVGIGLPPAIPASLAFRTTDCATNAVTGGPSVPADIPAGGTECYVIGVVPTAPFAPQEISFTFAGTNTAPVSVLPGINTLFLSGNSTPTADVVALAATVGGNGILDIPGATGTGAFSVAVSNVGITAAVTVLADTGTTALPLTFAICETDVLGDCKGLARPFVTVNLPGLLDTGVAGTATYAVFVTGTGTVALDPATNRVFIRFVDVANVARGATSVAVQTQ